MSSFSDFDEFLKDKDSQNKRQQEEAFEHIKRSRRTLDPLVRDIFSLLKDYYETILIPRRPYLLILKKQESQDAKEIPSFLYRVNFIPREILTLAFDPTLTVEKSHLTPREITKHDWHFDVGLQADMELVWSNESNHYIPHIALRAWGKPSEQKTILPSTIQLIEGTAWRHPYIVLTLTGNEEALRQDFKKALILVTPQVFAHLEEMWKIKK